MRIHSVWISGLVSRGKLTPPFAVTRYIWRLRAVQNRRWGWNGSGGIDES